MASSDISLPSAQELRAMTSEELREKIEAQRKVLVLSRFKHASANLSSTSDLKALRRSIARMETILNEKR